MILLYTAKQWQKNWSWSIPPAPSHSLHHSQGLTEQWNTTRKGYIVGRGQRPPTGQANVMISICVALQQYNNTIDFCPVLALLNPESRLLYVLYVLLLVQVTVLLDTSTNYQWNEVEFQSWVTVYDIGNWKYANKNIHNPFSAFFFIITILILLSVSSYSYIIIIIYLFIFIYPAIQSIAHPGPKKLK